MKCLDLTFSTPAENLACDEALLEAAEAGAGDEWLRFWEPANYFVVLGYANRLASEINQVACQDAGVPILRRCSGGGTVLQGPGCLNYSLICQIDRRPELTDVVTTNQFILNHNRRAIESLVHQPLAIEGCTDLTRGHLKFSGNAQRRRRAWLLFHGSFLLQFDLPLMERFLPLPSRQPPYRGNRPHGKFLTNLGVSAADVKQALRRVWETDQDQPEIPFDRIRELTGKYSSPDWTLRFP